VESPEKEELRSSPCPESSPSPISPCVKDFPSPVPLVLTPVSPKMLRCLNCEAEMTPGHQCESTDSDSSWEDVENEHDLYPTLDVESDDWAEQFTNCIRRFHGVNPSSPPGLEDDRPILPMCYVRRLTMRTGLRARRRTAPAEFCFRFVISGAACQLSFKPCTDHSKYTFHRQLQSPSLFGYRRGVIAVRIYPCLKTGELQLQCLLQPQLRYQV